MNHADQYTLILVGTGFASSFFLKKYLEKAPSSAKVLVLEMGVVFPYAERVKEKLGQLSPTFQDLNKYTQYYNGEESIKPWVFDPNFGGSSNCWTGCTPRFMPNDFKLKTVYGVGKDWPISYQTLEQYYQEVEDTMLISGPDYTPFPRKKGYPLPAHQLSTVDLLLQEKYGLEYISQPTARASISNPSRGVCCSSSVCDVCPANAKCTVENTFQSIYSDSRVSLLTETEVISLVSTQNIVQGVIAKSKGKEIKLYGDQIALATNAIGNAAILLRSGDTNPNTGKGISEQAGKYITVYFKNTDNIGGSSVITANGYMLYEGEHRKLRAASIIESFNLPHLIRNEAGKWRKIARFKFVYEDIPQASNFISIDQQTLKPKVVFKNYSEYLLKSVEQIESDFLRYFSFLDIERYEIDADLQKSEYHLCATTPMGIDSENSVVDKNLVHHQWRNLLVLGSSVFPSITPANPTLTISALSLLAANHQWN